MTMTRTYKATALSIVLMALLGGCASSTQPTTPPADQPQAGAAQPAVTALPQQPDPATAIQTPQDQVMARANARWEATLKGDMATSYGYTAPSYRKLVGLPMYKAKYGGGKVAKQAARVYRTYCPSEIHCVAVVEIEYQLPLGPGFGQTAKTAYEEKWVLEEGEWWIYPR